MNTPSMAYIQEFISERTGLSVSDKDLKSTVTSRMKDLGFEYVDEYCRFLETDTPKSKDEWKQLCQIITTGESFFFRDKGQFYLIRNTVIKDILNTNKDRRTLRIWSAGCSTGEEPYSLAITVLELLPDLNHWDVIIIGSDINEDAIEKARKGLYSDWSFRMVDPTIISTYFKRRKDMYELDEQVRRLVVFKPLNLIRDNFPDTAAGICDIDLIICRNVFIYFQPENIALALGKLSQTLNKAGYLITGHAELQSVKLPSGLVPITYPQSVVYRRLIDRPVEELRQQEIFKPVKQISVINIKKNVKIDMPVSAPQKTTSYKKAAAYSDKVKNDLKVLPGEALYAEAQAMYKEGKYPLVIDKAERFLKDNPRHYGAHVLAAQAYANTGDLERAAVYCTNAIGINSLRKEPYYMLAHIAEEQGNTDQAVEMFKRVIYLDAGCVPAYIELSTIYEHEGDTKRGFKLRESAVKILEGLPADSSVEFYDDMKAGELLAHLKKYLKRRASDWQISY
ncbi:MAG: tetratricopeptide repeat protein [Nitrospirota bacterium]